MMATFSCRAEYMGDVFAFLKACEDQHIDLKEISIQLYLDPDPTTFPDRTVEFQTETNLETLRAVLKSVIDTHVMWQTLRECPLSDNSLERNYDLQ